MKIEIGEYIRTKQGDISKVRYVDEENVFLENSVWSKNDLYEKTNVLYFDDEEIAKHSKNILDLVEVGDYLDGVRVSETYINNIKYLAKDYNNKTIVTKEQFSNMEYRL